MPGASLVERVAALSRDRHEGVAARGADAHAGDPEGSRRVGDRLNLTICAPSYRRPRGVDTLKYLPSCRIYVSRVEEKAYRLANPNADIVAVAPRYQGNLCRIRNHILDCEMGPGRAVLIIDDDLQGIWRWEKLTRKRLETEADVLAFVHRYTALCVEWGCVAWGINVNSDGQVYREQTPFSLRSYVGGPFMVHVNHKLRYDERLPLKEDYDFTLQVLNKHRKLLRVNAYYYLTLQMAQVGGCAEYRNIEAEREQLAALQRKWGREIVRADALATSRNHLTTKRRAIDVNPVIHPPIRGV